MDAWVWIVRRNERRMDVVIVMVVRWEKQWIFWVGVCVCVYLVYVRKPYHRAGNASYSVSFVHANRNV